jgi:hypothetical protein
MNDQELRTTLIAELGIGDLPPEAQDEIVSKLGEIILKSVTVAIFEKLSEDARKEFEVLTTTGDSGSIREFLARSVPDMETLMEEELQKTLVAFREGDQLVGDDA